MSKSNRISNADKQRKTAELLQQMSAFSSSGNFSSSASSKPTAKSGEKPGGVSTANTIGAAIANGVGRNFQREIIDSNIQHNYLTSKGLIEEAIRSGVDLFNGPVTKDNIIKATIRGLKEDDSDILAALDLADFCFSNGVSYESSSSDPITTRTLIVAGQNSGDNQTTIKNANTMAAAIRAGLIFDPKMVRLSAIKARDNFRARENTLAYGNLTLASIEKVAQPPDSDEALAFYSTVLATLANPNIQRSEGENSLKEVSERANLAYDIALAILEKSVPLNKTMPPGKLKLASYQRMDALIQDLRVISEKLSDLNLFIRVQQSELEEPRKRQIIDEEILRKDHAKTTRDDLIIGANELADFDPRLESDKLLEKALRLLKRVIKTYKIEAKTVNSSIGAISKIDLPLNKAICDVIKNIVKEALANDNIAPGIETLTLDVLSRVMIGINDDQVKAVAIEIASLSADKGRLFDHRTLERIHSNTSEVELRNDQIAKRNELPGFTQRAQSVIASSTPEPEHRSRRGLLEGLILPVKNSSPDGLRGGLS